MIERWKDIQGYEGLYQISNLGNVKSNYVHRMLPHHDRGNGYFIVRLCKHGKHQYVQLHRLVAIAFVPNPNHFSIVNHKDCNPQNNYADNLEWCTQRYNLTYGGRIQKMLNNKSYQEAMHRFKKRVYQYDLEGTFLKCWDSAHDVQRALGYSASNINMCCLGKRKTANKYVWRYERK